MLSFLRFESEKFAVQICSNVIDKNHMEEKNSNPTSVQCAH